MTDDRYDIFITAVDADPEAVSVAIADAFAIPLPDARRCLISLPSRVKVDLSEGDAQTMEQALVAAGAVVRLRKRGASSAPPPRLEAAVARPSLAPPPAVPSVPRLDTLAPPRRVVGRPVVVLAMLVTAVAIYVLFFRTPTMAGLDVHELGASEGAAVVLLHGYGASGDDLVGLGEELLEGVPSLRVLVVEAPHRVGFGGRAWFNGPESRRAAIQQMSELLDELEADGSPREQIVIAGFSQGAELAAAVSARDSDLAGTAILSGPPTPLALRGRVFVSHGRSDPIIPFAGAERAARQVATTADVVWFPFDGPHTTHPARPALVAWLRDGG